MSLNWQDIYRILAEDMHNAIEDPPLAADYVYNSLLTIINAVSENDGRLIETTFLEEIYFLFRYAQEFAAYMELKIRLFIDNVNKFTIKNYGDLTDFVNSIDWHKDCVPYYWWTISEDLGYDTSGWNGCLAIS